MSIPAAPPPSSNRKWLFAGVGAFGCLGLFVIVAVGGAIWWASGADERAREKARIEQGMEEFQRKLHRDVQNAETPGGASGPGVSRPAGPDTSTPRGTVEAMIKVWNAADHAGLVRLLGGNLKAKIAAAPERMAKESSRMKMIAVIKVDPPTMQDGKETCRVQISSEADGRPETENIGLEKIGSEWLVTNI